MGNTNCNTKNPLERGGTSQAERLPQALDPHAVQIDGKTPDDYRAFASEYAELIRYYDELDRHSGNWTPFFDDESFESSQPHIALFNAFTGLIHRTQADINRLTGRHLDFYYREVLKLTRKEEIPDRIHVLFELANNSWSHFIPEKTKLNAGSDAKGMPLIYETDRDFVAGKAQIADLKSVFVKTDAATGAATIHAAVQANSSDGKGGPLDPDDPKWPAFGNASLEQTTLGFAIASPLLLMQEGTRKVILSLSFREPLNSSISNECFELFFSGEKDWIRIPDVKKLSETERTLYGFPGLETSLELMAVIPAETEAIVPYNAGLPGERFISSHPVVKVLLKKDKQAVAYQHLRDNPLISIKLKVDVKGIRNFSLQNAQGIADPGKPFQLFGAQPVVGSTCYIGSKEVFCKPLTNLKLNMEWLDRPLRFQDRYAEYSDPKDVEGITSIDENSFKVAIAGLIRHVWTPLTKKKNLFGTIQLVNDDLKSLKAYEVGADESVTYSNASRNGFISLELTDPHEWSGAERAIADFDRTDYTDLDQTAELLPDNEVTEAPIQVVEGPTSEMGALEALTGGGIDVPPPIDDVNPPAGDNEEEESEVDPPIVRRPFLKAFGHQQYLNLFVTRSIQMAQPTDQNGEPVSLPEVPYTPTIQSLSIDYTAEETFSLTTAREAFRFFHIGPFGVAEKPLENEPDKNKLLPVFEDEGSFFIGLTGLQVPQPFSLLFQVAEGSADRDTTEKPIDWSYLSDNEWVSFKPAELLSDTTKGLTRSGVKSLHLPAAMNSKHTIMPHGIYWLKAAMKTESSSACQLIGVHTQVTTATFVNKGNDPAHLQEPLPASSIKQLEESDFAISKVTQPYASFGGRMAEQDNAFYLRASERLRHKNRAITIWDYERLILEAFPSVYKVKCLNHTFYRGTEYSEAAPGHITLIIVSNLRNQNNVNLLQPLTGLETLQAIEDFLVPIKDEFARLYIRNPQFEEIKVSCNVRFYGDQNFTDRLNEDLLRFLSPWAYEDGVDISFQGVIHKSRIINFIEELDYVDFVTDFKLFQLIPHSDETGSLKEVESAKGSDERSILVSVHEHSISPINEQGERIFSEGQNNSSNP